MLVFKTVETVRVKVMVEGSMALVLVDGNLAVVSVGLFKSLLAAQNLFVVGHFDVD